LRKKKKDPSKGGWRSREKKKGVFHLQKKTITFRKNSCGTRKTIWKEILGMDSHPREKSFLFLREISRKEGRIKGVA